MNKLSKFLFLSLIIVASCKKEEVPIGEPFDKSEAINGTWQLDSVAIIDETTAVRASRDITPFFKKGPASSKLTINSSDGTYSVVPGSGKNFFGTGGTWRFKNSQNPDFSNNAPDQVVFLTSDGDTVVCQLGSALLPFSNSLILTYVRTCSTAKDYDYAGYKHTFKRQ